MRITSKGQVTIPVQIRKQLGWLPNTEVAFQMDGDAVRITRTKIRKKRGRSIVAHLRGQGTTGMTTDEIMALMRGTPS